MGRKRRVLIVDDEPRIRQVFTDILTDQGIEVEEVADGVAALLKARDLFPYFDLVISNIKMPKLNGIQLVERLLQVNYVTPIMIVSALLDDSSRKLLYGKGVVSCLNKPIDIAEFLAEISKGFEEYDFRVNMIQNMIAQTKERHHNH